MTNTINKIMHNGDEFKFDTSSVSGITTTQPTNPTEGAMYYDTTNDVVKVYDGTNWVEVGKEYRAGTGISIGNVTKNGRQGPSPDGFHVPSVAEWEGLNTIMTSLSLTTGNNWKTNLHMPFAGYRSAGNADITSQGSYGYYWSSSPYSTSNSAYYIHLYSSRVVANDFFNNGYGISIRCFKDSYTTPDSSWTVVQGTLGSAGIFWNQSEGLISITDGTTGYTIMDKNLGATTVYNDGDTLTDANMGYMYQWGNNYGFPSTGTIPNTSSTQVDASNYGPGNYYSSDTFITGSGAWSSVDNDDLWGDTSGTYTLGNAIINTGVLSVNGQTGDVVIPTAEESNTKTFYISSTSDLTTAQAALDWYLAGKNPIIIYSDKAYIIRVVTSSVIEFASVQSVTEATSTTILKTYWFKINYSGTTVSSLSANDTTYPVLQTGKNYSTPYIPTYNGSPATKKYVDDSVSVVSGDSGTTYTIKVSNSAPASGTSNSVITFRTN